VFAERASSPTAVLAAPVVSFVRARYPIPVLSSPVVKSSKTSQPNPTFLAAASKVPVPPSLLISILPVKLVMLDTASDKSFKEEAPPLPALSQAIPLPVEVKTCPSLPCAPLTVMLFSYYDTCYVYACCGCDKFN